MRFLIVDDEAVSAELLMLYLRPLGECLVAKGKREGVALFASQLRHNKPVDVVFMDISLGDGSGHDAVDEMRAMEKAVSGVSVEPFHLIYVSGAADANNLGEALFVKRADAYLSKPFAEKDLHEVLNLANIHSPQTAS